LSHRAQRVNPGKKRQREQCNQQQINHCRFYLEKNIIFEKEGKSGECEQQQDIDYNETIQFLLL
jgi:hypothetical protein